MKKITIILATTIILITLIIASTKKETTEYPKTFVITRVTNDAIFCTDFNGMKWVFNADAEDWFVGDFVSAIMNNNGTENIYDDYFVSVKYVGWLDGSWGYDYETNNPIISMKP